MVINCGSRSRIPFACARGFLFIMILPLAAVAVAVAALYSKSVKASAVNTACTTKLNAGQVVLSSVHHNDLRNNNFTANLFEAGII